MQEKLRDWNRARDTLTFVDISAEGFDPARYGRPQLAPPSSALGEVYQFVVHNDALSAMKRRELLRHLNTIQT